MINLKILFSTEVIVTNSCNATTCNQLDGNAVVWVLSGLSVCIGTHGSGITVGNLATLVVKLELVTSDGGILTLSADDDDNSLFRAAQVCVLV